MRRYHPGMDETPRCCRRCDYDLRGIDSDICPECGHDQRISADASSIRGCTLAMLRVFLGLVCLAAVGLTLMPTQGVFPVGPVIALVAYTLVLAVLRMGRTPPRNR